MGKNAAQSISETPMTFSNWGSDDPDEERLPHLLFVGAGGLFAAAVQLHFSMCGYVVRVAADIHEAEEIAVGQQFECGVFNVDVLAAEVLAVTIRLLKSGRIRAVLFCAPETVPATLS
ncbi:MAG TPA: hypothetical protein VHC69_06380 [Polyangiaceae bacterium]|nr:hypothetical protein [Polyangiaceae bacterium]